MLIVVTDSSKMNTKYNWVENHRINLMVKVFHHDRGHQCRQMSQVLMHIYS